MSYKYIHTALSMLYPNYYTTNPSDIVEPSKDLKIKTEKIAKVKGNQMESYLASATAGIQKSEETIEKFKKSGKVSGVKDLCLLFGAALKRMRL